MTEELFLKEICSEAETIYWERIFEIIDSEPDMEISEETDRRITDYICKLESKYLKKNTGTDSKIKSGHGLKVLIAAAILILILALTAFAYEPFRGFISRVYDNCTEYIFQLDNSNERDYKYADYSYIPEGYVLVKDNRGKFGQRQVYSNNGYEIVIDTGYSNNSSVFIDTENAKTGDTVINGSIGHYSITDSGITVIWSTGKYYCYISADLNGDLITLDEVIKIAESRMPENNNKN